MSAMMMEHPDYLFESSWEVCNKVGGIYTVLSTKAYTLQQTFQDNVIFIGPDIWKDKKSPDFKETDLFADWKQYAEKENLRVKVGRWNVPGEPPVILVDYAPFFTEKNTLFFSMWNDFKVDSVDSIHVYGDYDESCIFAYAVGKVIESFYRFYHLEEKKVVALFNEWMLGMGLLYLQKKVPAIATLFTTHATSIGRSIAGNNKALYAYMDGYHGDQMAQELNMEAKHSVEKQAAHHADCFTTVSDITALECRHLLDKQPDIVTPNGFEPNFVPTAERYERKRAAAREILLNVAGKLLGYPIAKDAFIILTSGRYEYRNKGIDVFIEAMDRVRLSCELQRESVAFIMVPAWVKETRSDLQYAIANNYHTTLPMQCPFITHWLNEMGNDRILNYIFQCGFANSQSDKLKIIFVPCYLNGEDGIFNCSYYDLLIGADVTVYPSYYEPWGYTPLESIAFGIPTVTTNLAGFGLWAKKYLSGDNLEEGVAVANRTDFNYFEVADFIKNQLINYAKNSASSNQIVRDKCFSLAKQAEWNKFISYYNEAFSIALSNAAKRNGNKSY